MNQLLTVQLRGLPKELFKGDSIILTANSSGVLSFKITQEAAEIDVTFYKSEVIWYSIGKVK